MVPLEPRFCPLCGATLQKLTQEAVRLASGGLFVPGDSDPCTFYRCDHCQVQFCASTDPETGVGLVLTGARLPA